MMELVLWKGTLFWFGPRTVTFLVDISRLYLPAFSCSPFRVWYENARRQGVTWRESTFLAGAYYDYLLFGILLLLLCLSANLPLSLA